MARTDMFVTKQPGGKFIVKNEAMTTGDVLFVNSSGGTDGPGRGRNPDAPLASLAYAGLLANAMCTVNQCDIIFLMPGHAETINGAAGAMALDTAGISIIGLGEGALRATLTFDTDIGAIITIDAANIRIVNVVFSANEADITTAIDVNADDFTLSHCRFQATAANMNFLITVQDAAAGGSDRITIEDCYYLDRDASNTDFISMEGTGDGHIVRRNIIFGDFGNICIGGAGAVTNVLIADNYISNASNVNDSCIDVAAATNGIVVRNLCCGVAVQANGVTATACTIGENYYGVIGEELSAILDPPNA